MERKIRVHTTVDEGVHAHTHPLELPDGAVAPGTYQTGEADGHSHSVVLEEPLDDGATVRLMTSKDGEVPHSHEVWVEAFEPVETRARELARRETKRLGGHLVETKETERNGVRVGEVRGYIATWKPDTGGIFGVPDQFVRGAFRDSIAEHRARGDRPVRLKDLHGRTIGGFPIDRIREDDVGLYGEGEINLEVQQGREAFSLVRQGVLTDFSVGFTAIDDSIVDGIRIIRKAHLWEGSIVDEPANQAARILEVKSYREPGAALRAAEELKQSRGDLDPEEFKSTVLHLERQLAAFGADSPFDEEDRQFLTAARVEELSRRDLEAVLTATGRFSVKASKIVASRYELPPSEDTGYDGSRILDILRETKRDLGRSRE